jgi:glycosyltransferase involved in cell wall biosynthesis
MGRGALVLYLDTIENREVAGDCGLAFTAETLPAVLRQAIDLPAEERARLQNAAMARVQDRYSWDAITTQYERLFETLLG